MLNILYDYQIFSWQKYGGISRYFCELMAHSEGLFKFQTGGIFSINEYAKKLNLFNEYPEAIKKQFEGNWQMQTNLNQNDFLIKSAKCDVLHPTYYDTWFIDKVKNPFALTCYDFIHELFPQLNLANADETIRGKKRMIERASHIIAISQNTKNDLLKIYPDTPEEKVSVVYLGTSWEHKEKIKDKTDLKGGKNGERPYILYTGARNTYKNWLNFFMGVYPLLLKYDLNLKCTGEPFNAKETELLKTANVLERCQSQFANEAELKDLYANALCFAFPSQYEGFGIPILEAFACDCPMAISNASCFPEIAQDAALYFDPKSPSDIRTQIEKLIVGESLRNELVERGRERLKFFNWRKTAEETAKCYDAANSYCFPIKRSAKETVPCKICGAEASKVFDSPILKKYQANYFHCETCGFLFCQNAEEWLAEAYKESINVEDTGIMVRNQSVAGNLNILLYFLFGNSGKYLDFAGGYGFLVRLMRDKGFDFYWADAYSQNLTARGFEGDLNEQYNAVTSFESFEHFLNPIEEIDKLAALSKTIIFSTDLLPSPIPKPNEWWYYGLSHGQHISFYSAKTLQKIAQKYGLEYANVLGLHIFLEKSNLQKLMGLADILNNETKAQNFLKEVQSQMKSKTWEDHLAMAK